MRRVSKAIIIFSGILVFTAGLALVRCFLIFSPKKRAYCVSRLLHIFNKILAGVLGIKVELLRGAESLPPEGIFFVTNHFGYIDGIVASSVFPFIFIGKTELKNWPLLGPMFCLCETVFVNRADIHNIKNELERVKFLLNNKVNVILFPEGTSSDGKTAIPFKSSFFAAPLECASKIVPLTIRYTKINNSRVNDANKDMVYWYGDMGFFAHFVGVLGLKSIEVQLRVSPPLETNGAHGQTPSLKRKYLSGLSRQVIHAQPHASVPKK